MSYYPPVPSLPPASVLQSYEWCPPDSMSQIRRYPANELAMRYVYIAEEVPSVEQKFSCLRSALETFPFCVGALNAWAKIYSDVIGPPAYEMAEETYKLALSACRLLWPDLEQKSEIDWDHVESRPIFQTYHGLGVVQKLLEKRADAIEKYRFLLRVGRNGQIGVGLLIFLSLVQADLKSAEEAVEKHIGGRESADVSICYYYVLVDYVKFKSGLCTEAKLKATLVRALSRNLFVPFLVRGDSVSTPRDQLKDESPGSINEAARIACRSRMVWSKFPGILEWMREQQHLGGKKPNDNGTILFQLLQKGTILVKKKHSDHLWRLTTNVSQMSGQARPDFCLAPGMKEHNPVRIVAFDKDSFIKNDGPCLTNFKTVSYDDVAEIPFWNVLYTSKAFGNAKQDCFVCCEQTATLRCSVCQVTHYCSRTCQKKDWKAGHKTQCPKFIKT